METVTHTHTHMEKTLRKPTGCSALNLTPTPKSYVEILMPDMMVLEGGALGKYVGHEGDTLRKGISALRKKRLQRNPWSLPPCGDTRKCQL